MEVTPKSCKRKMQEESPSAVYDSFEGDTADVTYDFLPKTKMKGGVNEDCKIRLGQRPQKFIKSPNTVIRPHRLSLRRKQPIEEQEKCQNIFKDIFHKSENEKENLKESSDSNHSPIKDSVVPTSLFDDSSNDVMFELTQQVENEVVTDQHSKNNFESQLSNMPEIEIKPSNDHVNIKDIIKYKGSPLCYSKVIRKDILTRKSDSCAARNIGSQSSDEENLTISQEYHVLKARLKRTPDLLEFIFFQ